MAQGEGATVIGACEAKTDDTIIVESKLLSSKSLGSNNSSSRKLKANKSKLSLESTWSSHRTAWESLKGIKAGEEVIFENIEISKDGGLGDISQGRKTDGSDMLWKMSRPLSAMVAIFFIIYNIHFILNNAKNVIYGQDVRWRDFTFGKLSSGFKGSATTHHDYLVSTTLIGWLLKSISSDARWGMVLSSFVVIIEVAMLAGVLLWTIFRLLQAAFFACLCCSCCGKQRWKGWFYIAGVFFHTVPSLQSFSAMRLLYYIVPQVVTQQVCNILFYTESHKLMWLVWFVISRALCLLIGMDCFLIKYRAVATAIVNQPTLRFDNVMNAGIFLNQVLGVVQLTWAVRDRLYRFVFGGEDGIMTKPELIRRDIWEAKVAQRVWRTYSCFKAFSIMMTWNDNDFQTLVLRDVPDVEVALRRLSASVPERAVDDGMLNV